MESAVVEVSSSFSCAPATTDIGAPPQQKPIPAAGPSMNELRSPIEYKSRKPQRTFQGPVCGPARKAATCPGEGKCRLGEVPCNEHELTLARPKKKNRRPACKISSSLGSSRHLRRLRCAGTKLKTKHPPPTTWRAARPSAKQIRHGPSLDLPADHPPRPSLDQSRWITGRAPCERGRQPQVNWVVGGASARTNWSPASLREPTLPNNLSAQPSFGGPSVENGQKVPVGGELPSTASAWARSARRVAARLVFSARPLGSPKLAILTGRACGLPFCRRFPPKIHPPILSTAIISLRRRMVRGSPPETESIHCRGPSPATLPPELLARP